MEQKTKIIMFGLIGIIVVSLIISLQLMGAKQAAERERDGLKEEVVTLQQNLSVVSKESQQLKAKLSEVGRDLDRLSRERQDIQKKYDSVSRERADLIETIEKLKKQVDDAKGQSAQVVPVAPPTTDDTYWSGILKAKVDLELQLQNIRTELKNMQVANEQLQREKGTLSLEVSNLNREKEDIQRQLNYNQKLVDNLASELVREKNDKMQLEDNVKPIKNENQVLMRQLKTLNERKVVLEKDLAQLQADKGTLARRIDELEALLKDQVLKMEGIRKQVDDVRGGTDDIAAQSKSESVELPPILVRPQTNEGAAQTKLLTGKVLAINKDNNFVIVDLGENAGVKLGQGFNVYRNDKSIAGIEVIQVRKDISACDIKRETTPIKIGDVVK